jgi:hypothetical protein
MCTSRSVHALALVSCLFFGFLIGACGSATGTAPTAPAPVPPVTPAPTTTVPVISNLTANFATSSCTRAADGLVSRALVITFDYVDGPADLSGGSVQLNRLYNTGRSESHVSPVPAAVTLIGTPTSGLLRIDNACPLYDNASSSVETLTLIDADGRASNSLSTTVTRLPGAP